MALGMRNKFDIGQAIVQTAGYGLGAKLQKVPSLAVRDAIKAFGTTVLSSVISGHRLDLVQLAANFAGNYAQDKTAEIMQDHQRQEAERAIEQHQEAKQDARRTAVARQDRTTQEGREVAPTPSHRSQDEETTVPTTASRRRSFFGDDQETRSTLADASRATRAKAATSALATATTRHSAILTDISTDDAILDATREALSGTFATPDSQAIVSLRGDRDFSVSRFGEDFHHEIASAYNWGKAVMDYTGKAVEPSLLHYQSLRYSYGSAAANLPSMSRAIFGEVRVYVDEAVDDLARAAGRAEMIYGSRLILSYAGKIVRSPLLIAVEGAYELWQTPTLKTAYEVAGETLLGGIGGGVGAVVGGGIGFFAGPIGGIVGGVTGTVVGGAAGYAAGRQVGDWLYSQTGTAVRQTYNDVRFFATRAYDSAEETVHRIDSHY